ncbi:MAG: glucosamine-6-phosphate deaminase, partial [Phycisphaerae bacterium]|nr:glucosamine-6-phosphate deaminase [Phycisphaerae bacterium]
MKVIVVKDEKQMGRKAAELVAAEMRKKEFFVLSLATGSTPLSLYKALIEMHKNEGLDFSTAVTFNLDEYIGLPPDHEQSYRHFMDKNLFDHININKKNTHIPDGLAEDIEAECEHYEQIIEDVGGIDVQVVGIGGNGH